MSKVDFYEVLSPHTVEIGKTREIIYGQKVTIMLDC
jgi:hypothetical protein